VYSLSAKHQAGASIPVSQDYFSSWFAVLPPFCSVAEDFQFVGQNLEAAGKVGLDVYQR
jgi:hypothetical protein